MKMVHDNFWALLPIPKVMEEWVTVVTSYVFSSSSNIPKKSIVQLQHLSLQPFKVFIATASQVTLTVKPKWAAKGLLINVEINHITQKIFCH